MGEWLVTAVIAGLMLCYFLMRRPKKIPMATTVLRPMQSHSQSSQSYNPPPHTPVPFRSSSPPYSPSPGPMPVPTPIPLLSTSLIIPPYYHKPNIPDFSSDQRQEAIRHVYTQLQAQPDDEELVSVQQLLARSYWSSPAMEVGKIDGEEIDRHKGALKKILMELIRIAMEEKAKLPPVERNTPAAEAPSVAPQPPVNVPSVPSVPSVPPTSLPAPTVDNLDITRKEIEETLRRRSELPPLPSELNGDLNEIIGQITSDVSDFQHLFHCAQRCLNAMQKYPQASEVAVFSICEKVLNQCRVNVEDIENGSAFALNYTNFILEIAEKHGNMQRIFRDLLYSKRKILVPTLITDPSEINKRLKLQDVQPDVFESQTNLTRAFGAMRAALNCHPKSQYGLKEGWMWLARLVNVPTEQVDRLTISALTGFIKVIRLQGAMKSYGTQGKKLLKLMKSDYFPTLKTRFWEENQLYHTGLAMLERAITDIVSDFP